MTAHHDRLEESRLSTPGDYEREAELTRRRLADHLDELSDRLTPGQVFDEMLTYSRAGSGTFLRAFSNAVRENPLPSLLIGAGCMMFLSEKMGLRPGNGARHVMATADEPYRPAAPVYTRAPDGVAEGMSEAGRRRAEPDVAAGMSEAGRRSSSAASRARSAAASVQSGVSGAAEATSRQASSAAGAAADTMRQTAATVGDTVAGAADAVSATGRGMRDQASDALDQARRSGQSMAGAVRDTAASMSGAIAGTAASMSGTLADTASSMGGALADTADRTRRQAADVVRQSRESAASFITEQPLLCAAIGVAVGAALASLLPSTETEDKLMGEASDAVKGTAGQVGSDALESAKNVASKVAERAQTAVKEEGLSPSAVADAARNLGEGIRQGAEGGMNQAMTGTGPQEGTGPRPA
jgi:ElaB/YqjD/DUF883 family membrane-anchored ribosome-binding protein